MTGGTGALGAWRLGAAMAATVTIVTIVSVLLISTANGTAHQSENVASPEALALAVRAVVGLRAEIPADASTAASLGTERSGNGVLIDSKGLVRTLELLAAKPLRLGATSELTQVDAVLAASFGGPRPLNPAYIVSRRAFAGYWEYLL